MSFFNRLFGGKAATTTSPDAIPAAEARTRLADGAPPFVLDVRERHEFQAGHIKGARLIPLGELANQMGELPRDREILVVCRSGNRSGTAARRLAQAGYRAVNLTGGMIAWQRAGYPIEQGK